MTDELLDKADELNSNPEFGNLSEIQKGFIEHVRDRGVIPNDLTIQEYVTLHKLCYMYYISNTYNPIYKKFKDVSFDIPHKTTTFFVKPIHRYFNITHELIEYINNLTDDVLKNVLISINQNCQVIEKITVDEIKILEQHENKSITLTTSAQAATCLVTEAVKLNINERTLREIFNIIVETSNNARQLENINFFIMELLIEEINDGTFVINSKNISAVNALIRKELQPYLESLTIIEQYKIAKKITATKFLEIVYESSLCIEHDIWMKYYNNYEEYKDIPTSWWLELV